jgi:hypothetical protein
MTNRYLIQAWCVRRFITACDVDAETPEQAVASARKQQDKLLDAAEECDGDYPWDEFAVYDDDGKELLHIRERQADPQNHLRPETVLLDMLRYGVITVSDGEAEFDGVMYVFDSTGVRCWTRSVGNTPTPPSRQRSGGHSHALRFPPPPMAGVPPSF